MIILGVDPGTAIVGWGVIDTGASHNVSKATCLGYGCVLTDKSMTTGQRLVAVAQGLAAVLSEYSPEVVSVEKLFFAKNITTAMGVSQARGVILLTIEQAGKHVVEYTPLQVKQALTGYGQADKKQIQHMTQLLLHLPGIPKPDDAADALAIAITAAQSLRLSDLV